jgi:hypothetical protein
MSEQSGSPRGADSDTGTASSSANRLPQTASPLPLLGLLGFGSFAAGWVTRKFRR